MAILKENLEVARTLLENGADVNIQMNVPGPDDKTISISPLTLAVRMHDTPMVRLLQTFGAHCNSHDVDPLCCAIFNQKLEILQLFLNNGLEVNAKDKNNIRPLTFAIENNCLEAARLFLENGANPRTLPDDSSPLHHAAMRGFCPMIELLLDYGADPFAKIKGFSPLCFALAHGHVDAAHTILNHHPKVKEGSFDRQLHERLMTSLMIFKRMGISKDIRNCILKSMPEDLLNQKHANTLIGYGADLDKLVETCPLEWFYDMYNKMHHTERQQFVDKVAPALARQVVKRYFKLLDDEGFKSVLAEMNNEDINRSFCCDAKSLQDETESHFRSLFVTCTLEKYPTLLENREPIVDRDIPAQRNKD